MSFYDDASLVFLPSGQAGKDGKAYSMKPTNGNGDFTFSRGSNLTATRVDSNGLIAKGRENLFLNSDTPATQSITITNGGVYVLSFLGTGSIVASGGGSFTLNGTGEFDRVENYFISSSTSVTLTISGTITEPQLELGLAATEYIETGATTGLAGLLEDSPRFDYSGGASCPSLLLEPSRTNLVTQSEYMLGSNWLGGQTTITPVLSPDLSPEGKLNAYRITRTSSNTQLGSLSTVTSGQTYTGSIYIKRVSGSYNARIKVVENTSTTIAITDEWERFDLTAVATSSNGRLYISPFSTGDVIDVWGAQLEEGSYPTSYIPNHSGGSVTREADSCSGAGTSSTFNDSEGVLYAEIAALADDLTFRSISLSDGTNNNRVIIRYRTTSNIINFLLAAGGSVIRNVQHSVTDITDYHKVAIKYKDRDIGLFVDGVKIATHTDTFTLSSLSEVSFTDGSGSDVFYGKPKQVLTFNTALSDNNCITLTS